MYEGGDGSHGGSEGMTGRNGEDCIVRVPLGTIVTERINKNTDDVWDTLFDDFEDDDDDNIKDKKQDILTTSTNNSDNKDIDMDSDIDYDENDETITTDDIDIDEENENETKELIKVDLDLHHSYVVVAYGGKSGVGNANIKRLGSARKGRKSIPVTAMPGESGEKKSLELELKIIADVGLVGMPNVSDNNGILYLIINCLVFILYNLFSCSWRCSLYFTMYYILCN